MKKIKIYCGGGWFSPFQDKALTYQENYLFNREDFEVYAPRKEIKLEGKEGIEIQNFVFNENCKNIDNADLVVISTVDKDMGSVWEAGYAYARNKKIVYTLFDERLGEKVVFNLMLAASGIAAFTNEHEFEKFMNKLNSDTLLELEQRYKGDFE